jgi:hypothetical protein
MRLRGLSGATDTSTAFSTTFPADENPISQGGIWQRGASEGTNWSDPQTSGGHCLGTVYDNNFDDNICHLKTSYRTMNAAQWLQCTTYRDPAYVPGDAIDHECELLLRFSITSGSATGYELIWGQNGKMALVRWNGAQGDYTTLTDTAGAQVLGRNAADGDVVYAKISGNIINANVNGTNVPNIDGFDVSSVAGSVWSTGQTGMGFFIVAGGGADLTKFCWRAFSTDNL